jgi:SAM-dependent methyltransferase
LKQKALSVCDVGCGNGRLATFLLENMSSPLSGTSLQYLGLDQDQHLLEVAKTSFAHQDNIVFRSFDVIKSLLDGNVQLTHEQNQFDIIACFGVIHHIPDKKLRALLLKDLAHQLNAGGVLLLACWQFDRNSALFERQQTPESLGFSPEELEPNDYFLTWERDTYAVRYCHLVDQAEQDELIHTSGLKLISRFDSDGKSADQNTYLVLQKS